jgi:hypothetical protein
VRDPRNDRFAGGDAERTAHEFEILHGDGDGRAFEISISERHRVLMSRLRAIFLHLVDIALDVAEFQRIGRRLGNRQQLMIAIVEQIGEARLDRDAHVIARTRHHIEIGLDVLVEHELAALRALHPKIFRPFALEDGLDLRRNDVRIPVHR